jgi:carboxyl-terminal processing protease
MMRRETLLLVLLSVSAFTWSACGSSGSPGSPTAPSVPPADFAAQFDSLWSTFDREYSYFEHKRIDWNALRTEFRPRAVTATDQLEFIGVIREMLGRLHDSHVVLRDPGGAAVATYQPQFFVNWDQSVWQQYLGRANWTQGQSNWGYGVLDGVPYIAIGGWSATSIRAGDFDFAFERFRSAPMLILDVRMNGGGNDSLAFEIAGRFARTPVVFGYVRFRSGPSHADFGPAQQRVLNPRGAWQFTGTVLLLIGRRCASSNESFIAAMGQLPNVTLVGDRTAGSTGNPGTFPLANGWTYTVSRWIEYTADNQVIEDVGISPDVFVPAGAADFMQGRDPVLDWALNRFRSPTAPTRIASAP